MGTPERKPVTVVDKDASGTFRQRRRGGRFCAEVEATVYENGNESAARSVLLTNVSMAGIGFQSTTALPVGSVHGVHLDVEYMWLNSPFEVIRCDRRPDGFYDIGGEFVADEEPAGPFQDVLTRSAAD